MIGLLPQSLDIGGRAYAIRSDYRAVLNIIQAFNDPQLSEREKCYVCLKCLYVNPDFAREQLSEAAEKAYWFVGGGDMPKSAARVKTIDWEHDESVIFPAVSKAAGYEVRSVPYLHWWVFIGLFNEIGDGLFAQVVSVRQKLAKGKKLEKWEREFYSQNRRLIDLNSLTDEQEREDEELIRRITGEV